MIVTAIYLLYMLGKVVFAGGAARAGYARFARRAGADLNRRDRILVPLAALCLILGLYPTSAWTLEDRRGRWLTILSAR